MSLDSSLAIQIRCDFPFVHIQISIDWSLLFVAWEDSTTVVSRVKFCSSLSDRFGMTADIFHNELELRVKIIMGM